MSVDNKYKHLPKRYCLSQSNHLNIKFKVFICIILYRCFNNGRV